jgi:hypothetical protein
MRTGDHKALGIFNKQQGEGEGKSRHRGLTALFWKVDAGLKELGVGRVLLPLSSFSLSASGFFSHWFAFSRMERLTIQHGSYDNNTTTVQ